MKLKKYLFVLLKLTEINASFLSKQKGLLKGALSLFSIVTQETTEQHLTFHNRTCKKGGWRSNIWGPLTWADVETFFKTLSY